MITKSLRLPGIYSRPADSYLEVIDFLTDLRDAGEPVTVKFLGASGGFRSRVLAINAPHHVMVVESSPSLSPFLLRHGRPVDITIHKHDRRVHFRTEFLECLAPEPDLGYQIAIPESIENLQSRQAFRHTLDPRQPKATVTLLRDGNHASLGTVEDISKLGLGIRLDRELAGEAIRQGEPLQCKLFIEGQGAINCEFRVSNLRHPAGSQEGVTVGGRFAQLRWRDRLALQRFVDSLRPAAFAPAA